MQVVHARDGKEYTVADGYEWFWNQFASGAWEPRTFEIFDKFLDPERTFLDIGAWIGPTTLYAASRAKDVFCFEPDPIAYKGLVQNLTLNRIDNVVPYPVAVANKWKGINFGARTSYGDSMSSEIWAKAGNAQVPAVSLQGLLIDLNPNFVKIDIEGGEKTIFDGARVALSQMCPTIHLSLHTPWFERDLESFKKSIMDGLDAYPYFYDEYFKPIKLEDAFDVNAFNSIIATFTEL